MLQFFQNVFNKTRSPESQDPPPSNDKTLSLKERLRLKERLEQLLEALSPTDLSSNLVVAEIYSSLLQPRLACDYFRKVLQLDPNNNKAEIGLARSLIASDSNDDAIAHLARLRELNPESQIIPYLQAEAHKNKIIEHGKKQEIDSAASHFKQAIEILPTYAPAHLAMGITRMQQGRYADAVKKFFETLKMDSNLAVDAHHYLGLAFGKMEKVKKSIWHLKEAARINPKAALVHRDLADLYFRLKKYDLAAESYKVALTLSPALSKDAFYKQGLSLIRLSRFEEALEPLREAHRLSPKHEKVRKTLAEALYQASCQSCNRKDYKEGLSQVQEASRIHPSHAKAQFALSDLHDRFRQDGKNAITHALFAKNFFLEQKNKEGLAESMNHLEKLYKKYRLRPEDFEDLIYPAS